MRQSPQFALVGLLAMDHAGRRSQHSRQDRRGLKGIADRRAIELDDPGGVQAFLDVEDQAIGGRRSRMNHVDLVDSDQLPQEFAPARLAR